MGRFIQALSPPGPPLLGALRLLRCNGKPDVMVFQTLEEYTAISQGTSQLAAGQATQRVPRPWVSGEQTSQGGFLHGPHSAVKGCGGDPLPALQPSTGYGSFSSWE